MKYGIARQKRVSLFTPFKHVQTSSFATAFTLVMIIGFFASNSTIISLIALVAALGGVVLMYAEGAVVFTEIREKKLVKTGNDLREFEKEVSTIDFDNLTPEQLLYGNGEDEDKINHVEQLERDLNAEFDISTIDTNDTTRFSIHRLMHSPTFWLFGVGGTLIILLVLRSAVVF